MLLLLLFFKGNCLAKCVMWNILFSALIFCTYFLDIFEVNKKICNGILLTTGGKGGEGIVTLSTIPEKLQIVFMTDNVIDILLSQCFLYLSGGLNTSFLDVIINHSNFFGFDPNSRYLWNICVAVNASVSNCCLDFLGECVAWKRPCQFGWGSPLLFCRYWSFCRRCRLTEHNWLHSTP